MDFSWVGLIYWLFVISSLLLFIWGLGKKSWKAFILSAITLILPTLYFSGAENWVRILVLLPLLPFLLAFITRKKQKNRENLPISE